MSDSTLPQPVELLRDRCGVYGIGVSDLFDYEALAWSCGIEPKPCDFERIPGSLILRPDRLPDAEPSRQRCYAVLQKINGGFRRSIFHRSIEEKLRQFIHHEALRRAGLPWPPRQDFHDPEYWSADKKQQARNRGIYHGLRLLSLHVINRLIGEMIKEAADADAIKAARRFAFEHREHIYRAGAQSRRALQLTDTFPVLAITIYSDNLQTRRHTADFTDRKKGAAEFAARKQFAADLVERGARLRDVAAAMAVPMTLRCVKPSAAHLASDVFCEHPELLQFMPATQARARKWLRLVSWAHHRVGADFGEWVACNVPQIPGRPHEVRAFLSDIADWVRASAANPKLLFDETAAGRQFVVRPFASSMSVKTVTALSADWHEAVANDMDGPARAFPAPWYPAAKLGDFDILPIDNSAELYREGKAMHHCVGTYGDNVQRGDLYVYSVRCHGERLATLALTRKGNRGSLTEIRGLCNALPPKNILSAVRRWLRAQGPLLPPAEAYGDVQRQSGRWVPGTLCTVEDLEAPF